MTGICAATRDSIARCTATPPSSFTAWAPPSFTSRMAFRTASSGDTWYEPKGMSATTRARCAARATRRVW